MKAEKIISALPSRLEWRANALLILIALCSGEKARYYDGWSRDFRTLRKATGIGQTVVILDALHVRYEDGNDAPRGGALGRYLKLTRRAPSVVPALRAELQRVREIRGY